MAAAAHGPDQSSWPRLLTSWRWLESLHPRALISAAANGQETSACLSPEGGPGSGHFRGRWGCQAPHCVGCRGEPCGRGPAPGSPLQAWERNRKKGVRGSHVSMGHMRRLDLGVVGPALNRHPDPLPVWTWLIQASEGKMEVETHAQSSLPWIISGLW